MNKKVATILLGGFAAATLLLNPRVSFNNGKPIYVISCSTGFSLISGEYGLWGIYSLEQFSMQIASSQETYPSEETIYIFKQFISKPCQ